MHTYRTSAVQKSAVRPWFQVRSRRDRQARILHPPCIVRIRAAWSRVQISHVAPGRERYPTLRLARVLDLENACAVDPVLADLMARATTVVRLPRSVGGSSWLSDDIRGFDPAFMLFSPHVGELALSDRTAGTHREIKLSQTGDEVTIKEGHDTRRWRVFSSSIRPSQQAKTEAWELSAREELPVVWAAPLEGRSLSGGSGLSSPCAMRRP